MYGVACENTLWFNRSVRSLSPGVLHKAANCHVRHKMASGLGNAFVMCML